MRPEVKAAWVAALRSGRYQQGKGRLRDPATNAFCCLGVLCDIGARKAWDGGVYEGPLGNLGNGFLPTDVRDLAKIPARKQAYLAALNDGGHSFSEIADWIEANL